MLTYIARPQQTLGHAIAAWLRAKPGQPVRHPPRAPRRPLPPQTVLSGERRGPRWSPWREDLVVAPAAARPELDPWDQPPSGSMDTSMRWSPSLSAVLSGGKVCRSRTSSPADRPQWGEVGPFLPQIALSEEGRSHQEVVPCDSAPPADRPQWGALLFLGAHGGGGDDTPNRRRHGQLEEATAGPLLSD